jgi:diketogulonate reductase-like aldo/keto reductase
MDTAAAVTRVLGDGNRTVARIAEESGRTPAQVLLRWGLQHELVVITKSTHQSRIHENAQIFDFALSADQMAELDARTGDF